MDIQARRTRNTIAFPNLVKEVKDDSGLIYRPADIQTWDYLFPLWDALDGGMV